MILEGAIGVFVCRATVKLEGGESGGLGAMVAPVGGGAGGGGRVENVTVELTKCHHSNSTLIKLGLNSHVVV